MLAAGMHDAQDIAGRRVEQHSHYFERTYETEQIRNRVPRLAAHRWKLPRTVQFKQTRDTRGVKVAWIGFQVVNPIGSRESDRVRIASVDGPGRGCRFGLFCHDGVHYPWRREPGD